MAIHSRILAGRTPWTEEPDRLQSMGSQIVGTTNTHEHTHSRPHLFLLKMSSMDQKQQHCLAPVPYLLFKSLHPAPHPF